MLAALTSRWIILGSHCSCKYRSPLAVPRAILFLLAQSNAARPWIWSKDRIHNQWD
jgi:hypothetical protein